MKNKLSIILLFTLSVWAAGCIKDTGNNFANLKTPTTNLVGFNEDPLVITGALPISSDPQEYIFYAEVNSSNNTYPKTDVTIGLNWSIVDNYNNDPANKSNKKFIPFEQMPDTTYQLENLTATTDLTTHMAAFKIKVFTNKLDPAHNYALGFQITTATNNVTISGNTNKKIVHIGPKNKYDGIYSARTYTLRSGDASKTGYDTTETYSLLTTGLNSNIFSGLQLWIDGSGIGIGSPALSIDPITNQVSISSDGGATNAPGYNSHYDPTTKTFYISFTWGAGPSARLATDTLTYIGPNK